MQSPNDTRLRRSIRLRGFDYSQAGAYFVTIVCQGRACLFGDVAGEEMQLNDAGGMVQQVWQDLPNRYSGINMDEFIVMPNHIHGVINFVQPVEAPLVGAQGESRGTNHRATTRVAPTLGDVVGAFKSLTTVEYVRGVKSLGWPQFSGKLWQRNYFEHVVRSEDSLTKIRQYIRDSPLRWEFDKENPLVAEKQPRGR